MPLDHTAIRDIGCFIRGYRIPLYIQCSVNSINISDTPHHISYSIHYIISQEAFSVSISLPVLFQLMKEQVQFIDASHQNYKSCYFFMKWIKRFWGWIYYYSISLTLAVLQRQKSLPDIGGTTYHSRCQPPCSHAAWRPHHERWAYTSNFVQYISGF